MADQTLISLAILKTNWDVQKKSFLDNFAPFVTECLRLSASDHISVPKLQKSILDHFGLQLPDNSILTLLNRLRKEGYVKATLGVYVIDRRTLSRFDFSQLRESVLKQYNAFLQSFVSYCSKHLKVTLSIQDAECAIHDYLSTNHLSIITNQTSNPIIPTIPACIKGAQYLIASFVFYLYTTHAPEIAYLDTLAKGSMLASAMYLPQPEYLRKHFSKTQIFFDTRFLLFSVGYGGKLRQHPRTELLALLTRNRAELCCFSHTLDECRSILLACARRIGSSAPWDAYGHAMAYFLEQGSSESDILLYAQKLEYNLTELKIRVLDKPVYVHEYTVDEKALATHLDAIIKYYNPNARDRDVDSISAVIRLRENHKIRDLESSRALFVTTNVELARAANYFLSEPDHEASVQACITDYALTNILWLKNPLKAPSLPMSRIIADCYAALRPSDALLRRYLEEVDRLSASGTYSAQDVYVLRYSLEARKAIMEVTLGDKDSFCEGTIGEVLEITKAKIEGDARNKLQEVEQTRLKAEERIIELETGAHERDMAFERNANEIAGIIVHGLRWLLRLVVLAGLYFSFPGIPGRITFKWPQFLMFLCLLVFAVICYFNLWTGVNLEGILASVKAKLALKIRRLLTRETH